MTYVFVDTVYWVAIANPGDQWHEASREASNKLGDVTLVTTDAVWIEFLTSLRKGPCLRNKAAELVRKMNTRSDIINKPQTRDLFFKALELYERRKDKKYSFTDCISMVVMKKMQITKILTSDNHFNQEGFQTLIKKTSVGKNKA